MSIMPDHIDPLVVAELAKEFGYKEPVESFIDESSLTPLEEGQIQIAEAALRLEMTKALVQLRKDMIQNFQKQKLLKTRDEFFKKNYNHEEKSLDDIVDDMSRDPHSSYWGIPDDSPYWMAVEEQASDLRKEKMGLKKKVELKMPKPIARSDMDFMETCETKETDRQEESETKPAEEVSKFFFKP